MADEDSFVGWAGRAMEKGEGAWAGQGTYPLLQGGSMTTRLYFSVGRSAARMRRTSPSM
jgi:hypothetical protein